MFRDTNGKLLVYTSGLNPRQEQLKPVSLAAEKMARILNLSLEIVTYNEEFAPVFVCYKYSDDEPVPIYCTRNGESDMQEIYTTLRNMMFVLSFHPKYSALRQIRREIMQLS